MRIPTSFIASALGSSLAAAALTAAAPASAAPQPVASATYGKAEVTIRKADGANRLELTYTPAPGEATSIVAVTLPSGRIDEVGLGLDATGLLTAVVASPSGLSWVHVTKPSGLKRLAKTAGAEHPAIYRGRVAYVCQGGRAICHASLRTKARRVLHREPKGSQWFLGGVRIGAGDAIATAAQRDGALGASRVQVKKSGAAPKTIADANLDSGEEVDLGAISPDGKSLTVIRSILFEQGEPLDDTKYRTETYGFPSGKRR